MGGHDVALAVDDEAETGRWPEPVPCPPGPGHGHTVEPAFPVTETAGHGPDVVHRIGRSPPNAADQEKILRALQGFHHGERPEILIFVFGAGVGAFDPAGAFSRVGGGVAQNPNGCCQSIVNNIENAQAVFLLSSR